jgi:murein DD-endopeptidase MepM/ murein hydrolase activator NlpD
MGSMDRRQKGSRKSWLLLIAILVAALAISLRVGGEPELEITTDFPGIGPRTLVTVVAREPRRGPRRVKVELVQGEKSTALADRESAVAPPWKLWSGSAAPQSVEVAVGSTVTEGLVAGEALIRVSVWRARTWLRDPAPLVRELALPVRLAPPTLGLLSSQHYPVQGGSEAVVYRVGEGVVRHGVEAGGTFFRGYPLPAGSPGENFALFAVPYDLAEGETVHLVAVDDVGNRTERAFVDRLRSIDSRHDSIEVGDAFMERVVPEIEAQTPSLDGGGSLVERYVAINSLLRVENRRAIADLAAQSVPRFLWQGTFLPLPNGQVMARFADRRTYLYGGQEIDRQDHLGYDLASVKHSPVPAGNSGVVVMAQFLGIYGNVIVIDHGYGLMSLYGHLSSFDVAVGDEVVRGQTIGHTGETGLAGGDHLHFGIFLQGVATDPVEWLDADWIRNRVLAKLERKSQGTG